MLPTTTSLEKRLENKLNKEGCKNLKAKQAIILVGGNVSNCTKPEMAETNKGSWQQREHEIPEGGGSDLASALCVR